MSPESPHTSTSSTSTDPGFGPNEWLVDEIYQQYLQDPNSVDRAWWDFFADYKAGEKTGRPGAPAGAEVTAAAQTAAAPSAPAAVPAPPPPAAPPAPAPPPPGPP
ncbi:2-oxoglutarate dehydrogenase E1 subunit family protein, partial [Streptacidiphilus carbonis]|uniref:2-oxoglutarate dehydrogenase E1 subunit family protein n=1 Tax=Streptacidiphilus carbonis TaxID=105422 RepID=UPI001F3A409C